MRERERERTGYEARWGFCLACVAVSLSKADSQRLCISYYYLVPRK
jgi:hypothetical protein